MFRPHFRRQFVLPAIMAMTAILGGASATASFATSPAGVSTTNGSGDSAVVAAAKAFVAKSEAPWTAARINFPKSSPPAAKNTFLVSVSCGIKIEGCRSISDAQIEAAKAMGWRTQQIDGMANPAGWNTAITQAIGLHPDVLALAAVTPSAVGGVLKTAHSKGIVVVCTTCGGTSGVGGVDNDNGDADIAKPVGVYSANYVLAQSGTKADVLILNYPELGGAILRVNAFKAAYAKCKGCKSMQIDTTVSEWGTTLPGRLQSILQQNPSINWIYNPADETAVDSVNAIKAAGLTGKVFAVGGNGELQSYQSVASKGGTYAAVPGASYYFAGWQAIDTANRLLHHQKPALGVKQPVRLFTRGNISIVKPGQYWTTDVDFRAIYKKLWGVR